MSGRKKDPVWMNFNEIKSEKRKGLRALCKICNVEIEGHVNRLKKHMEKCVKSNFDLEDSEGKNCFCF